jgi:hypothetical protein
MVIKNGHTLMKMNIKKYIDNYINNQKKPIIFVGLNDNIVYGKNKNLYNNIKYKYIRFVIHSVVFHWVIELYNVSMLVDF